MSLEEFIKKANIIHNNKYNYSLTEYKNTKTKITIICRKHGSFIQRPDAHLNGQGCPKCAIEVTHNKLKNTTEEFIKKAKEKFPNFDYSKTNYTNNITKITITCLAHGDFEILPNTFLNAKYGCPKCAVEKRDQSLTTEEFIKKAKAVHGNKYDYSKVNYIDSRLKVVITCPVHGDFEQQANAHLKGSGCPLCSSSKGENLIKTFLEENYITYKPQKKFEDLVDKKQLSYDFYLPDYNLLIEYNGEQHYKETSFKHHSLKIQRHHDWLKRKYAKDNNFKLCVIPYWEDPLKILSGLCDNLSFLKKIAEDNNLTYFTNEKNDLEIKDKNLIFHLANFNNGENDSFDRWNYYTSNGKRCVFVYPPYLKNKKNIYSNILLYHCGFAKRIYARNTIVKIFKSIELKNFFKENNIEGYRRANKAYALCDKKTLEPLMAYSLGAAYFGKGLYDAEIARGACKLGYQIIGGASKLWKAILNDNPNIKSIVYYVDRREYTGVSINHLLSNDMDGRIETFKGCTSFMNYWLDDVYINHKIWHKKGDYTNRETTHNKEVQEAYKDRKALMIKNPGSFVNVFIRN